MLIRLSSERFNICSDKDLINMCVSTNFKISTHNILTKFNSYNNKYNRIVELIK